jgi:hypothetical protein
MLPANTTINLWRARLFAGINGALSTGQKIWNDKSKGQTGLFGGAAENSSVLEMELPMVDAWSPVDLANQEKGGGRFFSFQSSDGRLQTDYCQS